MGMLLDTDATEVYNISLGRDIFFGLQSGVIIAKLFSEFVCISYNSYKLHSFTLELGLLLTLLS